MSLKCIDFLNVLQSIIVNDCFVICVGSSLLSKTVDVTFTLKFSMTTHCHYKANSEYQNKQLRETVVQLSQVRNLIY